MICEPVNTEGALPAKHCTKCGSLKLLSEYPPDGRTLDGRQSWCKQCHRNYANARQAKIRSGELVLAVTPLSDKYPTGDKTCTRCGAVKPISGFYSDRGRLRAECIECTNARNNAWGVKNVALKVIRNVNRKARVKLATPSWVNKALMLEVYEEAERTRERTGVQQHVDHFHPLAGFNYSGLHVPANLRVMPGNENSSKQNRTPPEHFMLFFHYELKHGQLSPLVVQAPSSCLSVDEMLNDLNRRVAAHY